MVLSWVYTTVTQNSVHLTPNQFVHVWHPHIVLLTLYSVLLRNYSCHGWLGARRSHPLVPDHTDTPYRLPRGNVTQRHVSLCQFFNFVRKTTCVESDPALCRSLTTLTHHTMSDNESSSVGPTTNRTDVAKTREKLKTSSVESNRDWVCLLWIDKAKSKDKMYMWVSVLWKTTN